MITLVRDWTPSSAFQQWQLSTAVTVVRGELEDYALLERVLNEYEVDTVFHIGAQTIVTIANRAPLSTFSANIEGTWKLLEAVRRAPLVKQVIVASSDKAYGPQAQLPYREDAPLQGRHPYDVSKSCADLIAQAYAKSFDAPVCITRCGNLFGGGDLNFNRLIPGTIRSAIRGERPVIRSDGTFIRDYLFVKDAVDAYLTLGEKFTSARLTGEAFNLSNELRLTVLEVAQRVLRLCERSDLEPTILAEARNEIPHQYLSGETALKRLNWKPSTDFDHALTETIAWYRAYFAEWDARVMQSASATSGLFELPVKT